MKKFIFTANVIVIISLVPAVIFGYLHNNVKTNNTSNTEIAIDVNNHKEEGLSVRLVKTF
jgi:hypothetical protein